MHGRLKIRSPEEQQALLLQEKEKKLSAFKSAWHGLIEQRTKGNLSSELLLPIEHVLTKASDIYTLWNYRREILLSDLSSWYVKYIARRFSLVRNTTMLNSNNRWRGPLLDCLIRCMQLVYRQTIKQSTLCCNVIDDTTASTIRLIDWFGALAFF